MSKGASLCQNVSLGTSFIDAIVENDVEDFTNVTPVMISWEITESFYMNRIIPKIKQNIYKMRLLGLSPSYSSLFQPK